MRSSCAFLDDGSTLYVIRVHVSRIRHGDDGREVAGNLCEIADLVEGFDLGVGVSWIPEELLPDISSNQFDPDAMEKMRRDGREWASTTAGWETTAPRPVFIGPRVLQDPSGPSSAASR